MLHRRTGFDQPLGYGLCPLSQCLRSPWSHLLLHGFHSTLDRSRSDTMAVDVRSLLLDGPDHLHGPHLAVRILVAAWRLLLFAPVWQSLKTLGYGSEEIDLTRIFHVSARYIPCRHIDEPLRACQRGSLRQKQPFPSSDRAHRRKLGDVRGLTRFGCLHSTPPFLIRNPALLSSTMGDCRRDFG